MPQKRFTIQEVDAGLWAVIDIQTDRPACVRDKVLTAMLGQEAYDAAELLNMIESWRHEPASDFPDDLALSRGFASMLRAN